MFYCLITQNVGEAGNLLTLADWSFYFDVFCVQDFNVFNL